MDKRVSKTMHGPQALLYVELYGVKLTSVSRTGANPVAANLDMFDPAGSECQAIRKVVREDDVVLDIGAGSMACALVAAKAGAARVIAYEPSPDLFALAMANIEANAELRIEAHFDTALWPNHEVKSANLRLPVNAGEEAAFAILPSLADHAREIVTHIEPVQDILRNERPGVVVVEASGMSCALTISICTAPVHLRPEFIIARLRPSVEGLDGVEKTISILKLMGFRLTDCHLNRDVLVFQNFGAPANGHS